VRTERDRLHVCGSWRSLLLAALLVLSLAAPVSAAPDPAAVAETIRRAVEQLRSTGQVTIAGQHLRSVQALPEIYESRGFSLLWTDPASEAALLGEIAASAGEGLGPADYHFAAIRGAAERRTAEPDDPAAAATVDLLMTDALLRLATHFYFGKVDAVTGRPRWDLEGDIRGESGPMQIAAMASGSNLAARLAELRPSQPLYGRLKGALARYRLIEREGGWQPVPAGRVLQAGMDDPRVTLLRRRLVLSGDHPATDEESSIFDPGLELALRRFQARHGLEPDGLFGPASMRAANRSASELIDVLRANLERARWVLADVRGRFLAVDPASAQVSLLSGGQAVLAQTATFAPGSRTAAEFRSDLRYCVVHPDWILPAELVRTQVAPLARRRPAALEARGLQVFSADGEPIDAARADWSRPEALIVRQIPGPPSFLGVIRFAMPNPQGLFLHGGPEEGESLPGAIRIEDPIAFARALAGAPATWSQEVLGQALAGGIPQTLQLAVPIPVVYAPWTAWIDQDGKAHFRRGFAERDEMIVAGLRAGASR